MNATILIKPCGVGNYQCLQLGETGHEHFVGDSERLADAAENTTLVYIAPAEAITLRTVHFDNHEKKILQKTLPYSLEEDLVDDVEDLHFALGAIANNTVLLTIVNRQLLSQWLEDLEQQGVEIQQLVSELQLLPVANNSWSLLVENDRWLLRSAGSEGFAMEADSASLALQLLLDQADPLPEQLRVYCQQDQQPSILSRLSEMLRGMVEWSDDDYWQVVADGYLQNGQNKQNGQQFIPINLLQGDYALSLPWRKWWKRWQIAAMLLLSATVLQLGVTFGEMEVLESDNLELRVAIERSYRSVVPKGAVMDPERQLRRKVNALKGSSGEGFVTLFDRIGKVLAKTEGLSLQSLNYTEKQAEIRLTVLANDFDSVETVRANLEELGLIAELTGSSIEGSKTRARLRIKG
ncbi:MAG: type II secretion system protein GspL [Pseudomonadales bacterium]